MTPRRPPLPEGPSDTGFRAVGRPLPAVGR